ncbi:MAG: glycosyltransferase N-terminal domain-containing protein [Hydrogenovibrio sp.]|uniref:3-deoxy-D-manno-octulosonic acid transferase n=1 Tax=Hydrogenovibrio sp. TaxID=2065821 RepID=UPI002870AC21|nr:glycosyltransferase N-terminal domain-containing protein [Hydrogenovibrio sp.]MDR9498778.1 glycosyltransferase N-terminal domain-containing protein [Hydrogenovibrio sp.]
MPTDTPADRTDWRFYRILLWLLSPLILLITLHQAVRRQGGWQYVRQRLGGYRPDDGPCATPLWIHCASVGEVRAIDALAESMLNDGHGLLVTTSTPSGRDALLQWRSMQNTPEQISHAYLPLDYPSAVRRFLQRFQPENAWMMESEIWPNLYQAMAERGPITLINARLSQKTFARLTAEHPPAPAWFWRWLQRLYRQTCRYLTRVLAKNKEEAQRFVTLGLPPERVQSAGNLKLTNYRALANDPNPMPRPYVLVASSHQDEEFQIAKRWLARQRPELLVIVPRHPQRRKSLKTQLGGLTHSLTLVSQHDPIRAETQVHLADTFGQLMPLYAHAQVVIMGGSFVPKGGHNLLEPASLGACLLTGPDMRDFEPETQALLEADGLQQCADYDALLDALCHLLETPQTRQAMGENAQAWLRQHHALIDDYRAWLLPLS